MEAPRRHLLMQPSSDEAGDETDSNQLKDIYNMYHFIAKDQDLENLPAINSVRSGESSPLICPQRVVEMPSQRQSVMSEYPVSERNIRGINNGSQSTPSQASGYGRAHEEGGYGKSTQRTLLSSLQNDHLLQSKFEERHQEAQRKANMISIDQAVIYEDGRCHFAFSDKSGLILHPQGECFTYFSSNGRKIRQLVQYALRNSTSQESGIFEKLLLGIQFHNSFGDEPLAQREEVYSKLERESLPVKITQAIWPGTENFGDFLSQDPEGNLILKTVDEHQTAQLVLSNNGLQFTVSYLYLLPFKKPQWQETMNQSVISSISSGTQKERRLRMMYEYGRVTQIFSVNRFLSRWCYPISLMLSYKQRVLQEQNLDIVFSPQYCDAFHSSKCCYEELVRGKEYSTELPYTAKPTPSNNENDPFYTSTISWDQQSIMSTTEPQKASLSTHAVWQQDEVSPSSFLHSYKKNVLLQWRPESTTRVLPIAQEDTNPMLEVILHQDDSIVFVREQGKFLYHYSSNQIDALLRQFTCDTVPFTVGDARDTVAHPRINMQEILATSYLILQQLFTPTPGYLRMSAEDHDTDPLSKAALMATHQYYSKTYSIIFQLFSLPNVRRSKIYSYTSSLYYFPFDKNIYHHEFQITPHIQYLTIAINKKTQKIIRDQMAYMQDHLYKELELEGLGKFEAYCNKSIKVVFEDRTIVRMIEKCQSIRILTRLGEEVIINLGSLNPQLHTLYKEYSDKLMNMEYLNILGIFQLHQGGLGIP